MIWEYFTYFAASSIILWTLSILILYGYKSKNSKKIARFFALSGIIIMLVFTLILWKQLERPPLRTLGETRLWYTLFLSIIGTITYNRWKYKWFFAYSLGMSILFLTINLLTPENYSKTLMPALQSSWFVPHVIVYIFAYALLAASSFIGFKGLYQLSKNNFDPKNINLANNLVHIGFAFLTAGLLFGALWAKEAWGHYWTWDPKETWAFLTWAIYLAYIHFAYFHRNKHKTMMWILSLAFIILLVCWFGINYLPAAQNSVHIYSN